jgi:hypothetical protein
VTELAADASVLASHGWRTAAIGFNGLGVVGSMLGLVDAIRHGRPTRDGKAGAA